MTVKILVVDDLQENLIALEALLRQDELEILEARSGNEALEALLAHEVALAVVDVQMPEMDGFERAELMRGSERTCHIPIIFVTAGVHDTSRVFRGYDVGAIDFLFKPIDPRILRHKAFTFIELYRQRQQLAEQLAQLRRSEIEARKLRDELEVTLRLNETFVAAVGHDLRNPLNAVLVGLDLLEKRVRDDDARRLVERVRTSGRRMARMIDELFDLARVRLGDGFPLHTDDVDLVAISERTMAELQVASADRAIELTHRGDTHGRWDAGRLEQVLSNLVANAIRYGIPRTPVAVEIDGCDQRVVELTVSNAGEIAPDVRTSLFDPFRRAHGHRTSEGLGLGLFIVQQVVEAHGGTIDVVSEEGRTLFRIVLPRSPSSAPRAVAAGRIPTDRTG